MAGSSGTRAAPPGEGAHLLENPGQCDALARGRRSWRAGWSFRRPSDRRTARRSSTHVAGRGHGLPSWRENCGPAPESLPSGSRPAPGAVRRAAAARDRCGYAFAAGRSARAHGPEAASSVCCKIAHVRLSPAARASHQDPRPEDVARRSAERRRRSRARSRWPAAVLRSVAHSVEGIERFLIGHRLVYAPARSSSDKRAPGPPRNSRVPRTPSGSRAPGRRRPAGSTCSFPVARRECRR